MSFSSMRRWIGHGLAATSLLVAGTAIALEADGVVSQLTAALNAAGVQEVTVGTQQTTGADVLLTDIKAIASTPRPMAATISSLILTAPGERPGGGLTASLLTVESGSIAAGDNQLGWQTARVENAVVPSAAEISGRAVADLFTQLTAGGLNLRLSAEGNPTTIEQLAIQLGEVSNGIPQQFSIAATGMRTGTEVVGRVPRLRRLMENLGYAELLMDVTATLTYQPDSGLLNIDAVDVRIAEFGTVRITGKAGGLPLSRLQSEATARELVAETEIDALTIRFENGGLVERGLNKQAEMMGISRADLQTNIAAALPLLLNILGNPEFQKQLAGPAGAFLQQPNSITFTMAPAEPVQLATIVSTALNEPRSLPGLLSVGVTAND